MGAVTGMFLKWFTGLDPDTTRQLAQNIGSELAGNQLKREDIKTNKQAVALINSNKTSISTPPTTQLQSKTIRDRNLQKAFLEKRSFGDSSSQRTIQQIPANQSASPVAHPSFFKMVLDPLLNILKFSWSLSSSPKMLPQHKSNQPLLKEKGTKQERTQIALEEKREDSKAHSSLSSENKSQKGENIRNPEMPKTSSEGNQEDLETASSLRSSLSAQPTDQKRILKEGRIKLGKYNYKVIQRFPSPISEEKWNELLEKYRQILESQPEENDAKTIQIRIEKNQVSIRKGKGLYQSFSSPKAKDLIIFYFTLPGISEKKDKKETNSAFLSEGNLKKHNQSFASSKGKASDQDRSTTQGTVSSWKRNPNNLPPSAKPFPNADNL